MSEHLALRSSVGSRSSALPSHQRYRRLLPPHPRPHGNPDPLTSVWIRRLHLTPNQPPPPRPPPFPRRSPPPPTLQDAVSTDESRTPPPPQPRSAGFGPFRWSPRPLRGAPVGAWDAAAAAPGVSVGGPPMLSPFFRLPAPPPPPVADIGEFAPFRPMIELGSSSGSGGFPGLSSRMVLRGDGNAAWHAARAAGAAYPSHALDMVPTRTLHDLHDRQHSMIPQNFGRRAPSSSSPHDEDEPFSYWNMGMFRRNTTTSSISSIAVAPGNFGKKRNADTNSFLPQKFRKPNGAISGSYH